MHLSTHTWMRSEPLEQTLERASRLGYSSIELAGEPDLYPIPETRELLAKYKLKCWGTVTIQHGDRDIIAADPQQRQRTIQYMKNVVAMSSELGGEIVTVVPGRVGKLVSTSSPEDEWRWAVEGLREVAAFAHEKNIRVALEPLNRFETYFINRSDQALALADEVGFNCGIAFDPFHLALEERNYISAIRSCGARIHDFHVSDHNRLAAGDGNFDWQLIIAELKRAGYTGGLAVEFMPPIDRTPLGKFGTKQLERNPKDIHPDQLQFIIDHGSGLLSDGYYTSLLERSAQTILPLIKDQ